MSMPVAYQRYIEPVVLMSLALIAAPSVAVATWRGSLFMLVASILLIAAVGILPIVRLARLSLDPNVGISARAEAAPIGIVVLGGGGALIALGGAADRIVAAVELARRYLGARIVFVGMSEHCQQSVDMCQQVAYI
jgi:uncharacterized SAM-binding protein YcdF (DUF218 family)